MTKTTKQACNDLGSKFVEIYTSAFMLDLAKPADRDEYITLNKLYNPMTSAAPPVAPKSKGSGSAAAGARHVSRIKAEYVGTNTPNVRANINGTMLTYPCFAFVHYLYNAKNLAPEELPFIYVTGKLILDNIQKFFADYYPECNYNFDSDHACLVRITYDGRLTEDIRKDINNLRTASVNQIDEVATLTHSIIKAIYKYIGLINAINCIKDDKAKLTKYGITAIYIGLQQQYQLFTPAHYREIMMI